jgi:hypothetical protein
LYPYPDLLETLSFEYNIRGWLKGINRAYNKKDRSIQIDWWFGMDLSYDWAFNANEHNVNMAGLRWRSRGDGEQRVYGFAYDVANRLLYGDFSQHDGSNYIANNTSILIL